MKEKEKDQSELAVENVNPFTEILQKDTLYLRSDVVLRLSNQSKLNYDAIQQLIDDGMKTRLLLEVYGVYYLPGSNFSQEDLFEFNRNYNYSIRAEDAYRRDRSIVKNYVIQNCSRCGINYRKTGHSWCKEITSWSGVKIGDKALKDCFEELEFLSEKVSDGVYCYGLKTNKEVWK